MWVKKVFLVLILVTACLCTEEDDIHSEDVHTIELTEDNFEDAIKGKNYFVMFFAPWCGHCKHLAPTWEQLAEMLNVKDDNSKISIGKVDCTKHHTLCSNNGVTGYPTLKLFKVGKEEATKYHGIRDLPSLSNFINAQLGEDELEGEGSEEVLIPKPVQSLVELTDETFTNHIATGKHFIKFYVSWCGHCQKLAPTWEELGKVFEDDKSVSVAKIDCTPYRRLCQDFEVKGYPTLLWIEDGKKIEKYSGSRTLDELKAYIMKMSNNNVVVDEQVKKDEPPVLELTSVSFDHGVEKEITFVKFYAPWCGHCKRLAPIWDELATKFVGNKNVKIAKVDCSASDNKDLCSNQEVEGFPTLFIYKNGEKLSEYLGDRSLSDLHSFITKHIGHDEL